MTVEFCLVTRENLDAVLALRVDPTQNGFVASNAKSLAQAFFYQDVAWFRAICVHGVPVGFIMTENQPGAAPFLWRLMIDASHQGQGLGRAAVLLLADQLRNAGIRRLRVSCLPGPEGPQRFYEAIGFVANDERIEADIVLKLTL